MSAASNKSAPTTKRYFGTDGIRGAVGQAPITPDFMLKLGWAAGRVFADANGARGKILIGKDTRISGYMFEAALEAGIAAAGVDIGLLGPMPHARYSLSYAHPSSARWYRDQCLPQLL